MTETTLKAAALEFGEAMAKRSILDAHEQEFSTMPRKRTQKTAEQIEAEKNARRAHDLEAVNIQPEAATLPNLADIEVTRIGQEREGQKVGSDSARRLDAFAALKDGMAQGAYDAARKFETDIMIRRGENDRGQATSRVDRTAGLTTDAIIAAAQRIEAVMDRISPRDFWLLCELIAPTMDRGGWRGAVAYITGESHAHGQGAAVRAACVNLRDAYTAIERKAAA